MGKACVSVEIADTDVLRMQGLMFRENLAWNRGMLFVFENEDPYSFWMKNTRIPLDIIWIGADKRVVYIKEQALPCVAQSCETYSPAAKAKYVLEVNSGWVARNGIRVGDVVKF
jgi:uncharacterized membrane protein (UPF0127 family)